MTENSQLAFTLTVYRVLSTLVGLSVVYMGYRLFAIGVYEKAGELKAAWGDRHLGLKSAAPGTFFALFGTLLISMSLCNGMSFENSSSGFVGRGTPVTQVGPEMESIPTESTSQPPAISIQPNIDGKEAGSKKNIPLKLGEVVGPLFSLPVSVISEGIRAKLQNRQPLSPEESKQLLQQIQSLESSFRAFALAPTR